MYVSSTPTNDHANPQTRAASRGQTPPTNLKERIAALQQRNVSPTTHQSAQPALRELSGAGTGGLRDKIAKFEEKGGVPVPRASFGMGAPQLAENAPSKKRGELYGNRVPGLGRPSGEPIGRSVSQSPSVEESGPRKRCISTGAALSSGPSSFSTDEPVPALPNGVPAALRRNSLAVNFGSGERVTGTSDAEGEENASCDAVSPLSPENPPEVTDSQLTSPRLGVEETPLEVDELEARPAKSPPNVEQALPTESVEPKVDTPAEQALAPPCQPSPVNDAPQNVSPPPTIEQVGKDEPSDHGTPPESAISQSSPSFPSRASSIPRPIPVDTPSVSRRSTSASTRSRASAVGLVKSPPQKVTKQADISKASAAVTPAPNPEVPVPPSIATPNLSTEPRSQSKPTFKAVVHRKVAAQPVVPATSDPDPPTVSQPIQQRRGAGGNTVSVSPTPGFGDLAVLLEDAALLELRLTEGNGKGLKAKELLPNTPTPTSATFQQPDPRHVSASTIAEHAPTSFINSGSRSERSVSIPSIREPLIDGEIPEGEETDGRSLASTTFSQRSPSHRKYLSNIYRLTGRRSSGAYPRDSMSMSSEDSSPVTTPSDNGKRKGFGIPWPNASPKKPASTISRSSSFADKIFNRSRTRSNVSSTDQASERNSLYEPSQPALTLTFPSELKAETRVGGVDGDAPPTSWISPADSNSEFSPASSLLDKDIFDAFPSVPQNLPPGFAPSGENTNAGRASTLPINGRKQVNQRLSMA